MNEQAPESGQDGWFIFSIAGLVVLVGCVGFLIGRGAGPWAVIPVATEAREAAESDDSATRQPPPMPEAPRVEGPRVEPVRRPAPPSAVPSSPGVTLGFDDIETACGDLSSLPNYLCLLNRGDEVIAEGARLVVGEDQASFTGRPTFSQGLTIEITGKERYMFQFGPPKGKALVPGHYTGAMRWPFNEGPYPGIDVSIGHRGCNTEEGQFRILQIQASADKIQRFVADFETSCNGAVGRIAVGEKWATESTKIELKRSVPVP